MQYIDQHGNVIQIVSALPGDKNPHKYLRYKWRRIDNQIFDLNYRISYRIDIEELKTKWKPLEQQI